MADQRQVERLTRSIEEWNRWRLQHPATRPDLSNANFSSTNLSNANLSNVFLNSANLSRAILSGANLNQASLAGAILNEADLNKAILGGAHLNGVSLNTAALNGADLNGAILNGADLTGADLRETDLRGADLRSTNLRSANITGVDLNGVRFNGANLSNTNLSNTKLHYADLSDAILHNTDLSQAIIGWTHLGNLDLCSIKGLETTVHEGPSYISTSTLERSRGNIPKAFLRGAGLNDAFIEYLPSLITSPIQYHSLFLSYSHHDQAFTKHLYTDLQNKGIRCWFAPHDLRPGAPIVRGIEEAIHVHEKLLLILSHHAVSSPWVQQEVEAALYKEVTTGQEILFPIRLDNTVLESDTMWAKRLRQRHIGDFTGWQNDNAYQETLSTLLRHLKVAKPPTASP